MEIPRWTPSRSISKQEQYLLSRLKRTRKLFAFLRRSRDEIFDDAFQAELGSMYRGSGAGKAPCPPALLAMATLMQGYLGVSDAEAVELTVVDKRWQMVLDRLDDKEPAFGQGTLYEFRCRLIHHDMDRRLLEKTVEVARRTGGYDAGQLKQKLRLAVDSAPFEGAGRVEDTINLLVHAARKVVEALEPLLDKNKETLCQEGGMPLLLASSAKRGLDQDWSSARAQQAAMEQLTEELESMVAWLHVEHPEALANPLVSEAAAVLGQIAEQDLAQGGQQEAMTIKEGVAKDRRISVEDGDMRHGRKSKSRTIDGYKRHIGEDLDTELIVVCGVTPANRPEAEVTPALQKDLDQQGLGVEELHVDLAYADSSLAKDTTEQGGQVVVKPRGVHQGELFNQRDFPVDLEKRTITCPAGQVQPIQLGKTVRFDGQTCGTCALRTACTAAKAPRGRTVSVPADEPVQQQRRQQAQTPQGRARLRQRVKIEHRLAHVVARQGDRARYRGVRKNLYDLRRTCALDNLETLHRRRDAMASGKLPRAALGG